MIYCSSNSKTVSAISSKCVQHDISMASAEVQYNSDEHTPAFDGISFFSFAFLFLPAFQLYLYCSLFVKKLFTPKGTYFFFDLIMEWLHVLKFLIYIVFVNEISECPWIRSCLQELSKCRGKNSLADAHDGDGLIWKGFFLNIKFEIDRELKHFCQSIFAYLRKRSWSVQLSREIGLKTTLKSFCWCKNNNNKIMKVRDWNSGTSISLCITLFVSLSLVLP